MKKLKKIGLLLLFVFFISNCSNPSLDQVATTSSTTNNGDLITIKSSAVSIAIQNADDYSDCTFEYQIIFDGKKMANIKGKETAITKYFSYKNISITVNAYNDKNVLVASGVAEILIDKAEVIIAIKLVAIDNEENLIIGKPVMTPGAGKYQISEFIGVTLTKTDDSAFIYYTIDNTTPDNTKNLYKAPISLVATATVKAIAYKDGKYSDVVSIKYELTADPVVSPVQFTPASGDYKLDKFSGTVLTTDTAGATIYYTIGSGEPDQIYSDKITFDAAGTYTIKAIAKKDGMIDSSESTVTYNITRDKTDSPVVTPAEGQYKISDFPGISVMSQDGVSFYYTLDGTEPNETSTKYTGKISLETSATYLFKVRGYKTGFDASSIISREYVISKNDVVVVAKPTVEPASGTYYVDQFTNVVITHKNEGGTSYYTTNGTTPNSSSTVAGAGFPLAVGTHTIKVISIFDGISSEIVERTYEIKARPSGKIVHFKADGTWPVHKIYYYEGETKKVSEWASMPSMTAEADGWFSYHMSESWVSNSTKIIFYGGDNSKRYPADQQPGVDVCATSEGYYLLSTKQWTETNPDGLTISALPGDSTFKTEASVLLKVVGGSVLAARYTIDGSDPKNAGTTFNAAGQTITFGSTATENQKVYLKVYATDGTKEVNSTFTYTKKSQSADLVIHFEKPDSWSKGYIHYWNVTTPSVWLSCPEMQFESGKWSKYTFTGEGSASFLFKDKAGEPDNRLSDQTRDKEGWFAYRNDEWKWFDSNPDNGVPAVITSNPQGGYFQGASVSATLGMIIDSKTTLVEAKYTIDGSDPKTNGLSMSNGTQVTVGSGLSDGQSVKVKIFISVKSQTNEILISERDYTYTKGAAPAISKLGANHTTAETSFSIWSPDTSNVKVVVDGTEHACLKLSDANGYTDVYGVVVQGDLHLKEYRFKVNGKQVRDPYGVMINNTSGNNVVIDLTKTAPTGGWATRPTMTNREDAIVYEAHIRDFTIDSSSGVSESKKGKYAGMVETGTKYSGAKTGIDHLKEIGVTHIQLLPFYDFSTNMYNWGYDPVNYNIPEEQYSMVANDPAGRVKELKEMINEFHKNGIRVVMDVVYNHTFANEMFADITNKYYTGNNDSGCGNGVNTAIPMVSRFIRDSLEYWATEYNIDGFRFDLIGIFHYDEVRKWGEYLNVEKYADRNLLMYGEPWNGYFGDPNESQKVRMGTTAHMASGHIGVFNGKYREDIKGDNDKKGQKYIFGKNDISWWGAIAAGMRGSLRAAKTTNTLPDLWDGMFAYDPEQSINYVAAHDNLCLWDKIVYSGATGGGTGYAGRVLKFAHGMVLTSQGIPFIHAGDEILRTKAPNGNWEYAHNTYNAPDEFNKIRWNWKTENAAIFNYHKDLMAIRKAHPGLRLTSFDEIKNRMRTEINASGAAGINCVDNSSLPEGVVISLMDEDNNVGNGYELAVIYNNGSNYTWTLPSGSWNKIFDVNGGCNVPVTGTVVAEGTAITILSK